MKNLPHENITIKMNLYNNNDAYRVAYTKKKKYMYLKIF